MINVTSRNEVPTKGIGTHQKNVSTVVADLSTIVKSSGFNCAGWDKIWVYVVFGDEGTKTCTIKPKLWQYCDANLDEDNGGWSDYEHSSLSVVADDGGRKSFLVDVYQKFIYLQPTAVGVEASFTILIQGAVRADVSSL